CTTSPSRSTLASTGAKRPAAESRRRDPAPRRVIAPQRYDRRTPCGLSVRARHGCIRHQATHADDAADRERRDVHAVMLIAAEDLHLLIAADDLHLDPFG